MSENISNVFSLATKQNSLSDMHVPSDVLDQRQLPFTNSLNKGIVSCLARAVDVIFNLSPLSSFP